MIVETVEDSQPHREHLVIDSLNISEPFRSLILIVHQRHSGAKLDVYVDCVRQGEIVLKKSLKQFAAHANGLPFHVVRIKMTLLISN